MWNSVDEMITGFESEDYYLDPDTAITLFLSLALEKPCLIEGPAGVGKTQLAIALAHATKRKLIRLQCYEGLDISKSLYDWNYTKQILRLQMAKTELWENLKEDLFSAEFLLKRPLLKAILSPTPVVLLIDEIDKSDEEFESFLLELLAEFQVTIPELGTFSAQSIPYVILTSNNTRDLSDALRRRCIHINLAYPSLEREINILQKHCPEASEALLQDIGEFVSRIRKLPLRKLPSVSESIDFTKALCTLKHERLEFNQLAGTLSILLKYPGDITKLEERLKLWQKETRHLGEDK